MTCVMHGGTDPPIEFKLYGAGFIGEIRFLSGGSDTRMDVRRAAAQRAAQYGEWLITESFMIRRQAQLKRRGLRHLVVQTGSRHVMFWVNYRKARKLVRKRQAEPALLWLVRDITT